MIAVNITRGYRCEMDKISLLTIFFVVFIPLRQRTDGP
jgi:hypothetical protein